jgi:class 3 adenylate cyclase/predicted ATPase
MRCQNCSTENPGGARFCIQCATPFKLQCPKCAFENPLGARFCSNCASPLTAGQAAPPTKASPLPTPAIIRATPVSPETVAIDGERKTVTALFADIKGSMDLMEDIDPEEARAIVDPALKLMIDAAHRYDGYVVQSTGDGVFALFGAPVAHEDHPQRALYAALRMQEDLKHYAARLRERGQPPLSVRVGVNTGEVVVRSIQTGDAHTEYTPIGHSISLAARLQTLATPGTVVIGESVRKFVEGYFQLKPLGASRIKGVSDPVLVHEVVGLGPLRTRLQRASGRGLTKFVARQREMEAMRAAAAQAMAGHGQIVAAIAEPGVGKSRLMFEFKAVSQSGWMVLETFSVAHGKTSAFMPVIDLLHAYFKIGGEDDTRTRREKVNGKVVTLDRSLEDTVPWLLALLGIAEGDDTLAQVDAQIRKRQTLEAIKRLLVRESINQPLMLIFEDLQWLDEETHALLNLIADSIGNARILLLVNYRPEYSHGWGSKAYYTQLRLDPLGRESADELLSALLGDDGPGLAALKRLIVERTEGNPFFMEETVQVLLDEGALVRNGTLKLTKPLAELKIPPTVQAILAARIDRLPNDEKDMLQAVAVVGKEFPLSLVREVIERVDDELNRMLNALQLAEFIYEQPSIGDVEYTFKHALTHEVAYNSVLLERRKQLHERIGFAMETSFAQSLDDHVGELARHYSRSANTGKAVEYLERAGRQALVQSAYQSALHHIESAIELLARLPDSAERAGRELDLQIGHGVALLATRGWYVREVGEVYQRAAELCEGLGDDRRLFTVLFGLNTFYLCRGQHRTARSYDGELTRIAERMHDDAMLVEAHWASGCNLFFMGDFTWAHASFERAIALYDRQKHRTLAFEIGQDPCVSCLCYDAMTLWVLGYPDRAEQRAHEALALARELGYPFTLAWCLSMLAKYHSIRRDFGSLAAVIEEGLAITAEYGFAFWEENLIAYRTIGHAARGELEAMAAGGARARKYSEIEYELAQTWARSALAEALAKMGKLRAANALLGEALALLERNDERYVEAELHRIKGELMLGPKAQNDAQAEDCFRTAIEISRKQQAKSWELRAAIGLARMLARQGRRAEARAILAETYGWFSEGFDTADLADAKTLLDELRP